MKDLKRVCKVIRKKKGRDDTIQCRFCIYFKLKLD